MIRMRTELLGSDAAMRALDEVERRMGNLSDSWRQILADWKAQQKTVFPSEGASIGAHWPPLDPRTEEWKARHYGHQMLVRTGSLRAAVEGHGSGFSEKIAPLALEFKITERTAQFQAGRRPLTRFGAIERIRWLHILQMYADRIAATVK